MPNVEITQPAQFAPEVPNEAIAALQVIKTKYAQKNALSDLRSSLCKKLNIKDVQAGKQTITTPKAAVTKVRTVTEDIFSEQPSHNENKSKKVAWLMSSLEDLVKDYEDGGTTDTIVSGNRYIARLQSLFEALNALGLELSDIITGQANQNEIDEAIFQSYVNGMIKQAIDFENDPAASIGVYRPATSNRLLGITLEYGQKHPHENSILSTLQSYKKNPRYKQYLDQSEDYKECIKLYLVNNFKRILAKHYRVDSDKLGEIPQIVKLEKGVYWVNDLSNWLRTLHEHGLTPKEILGVELYEFFQMTEGNNNTPLDNEDLERQIFEIVQDTDDRTVDLEERYPDIAYSRPGDGGVIQSGILLNFLEEKGLKNVSLLTRRKIDPRNFLAIAN